ncbi:peptide-N-glycosidase F-related protein [Polyangium jinanense]|uniref:Peptide-N-glycosidase F N-terminal domain-containing protein n=1 Tax=Polyangium jinanense TaxID=2829994 RepID=A0A9X3XBN4_9BACT|nr:peptide-N-glycosidase F-related protein [Polyangium jinanense]MDC3985076.1 hypothetical protein [Polyangium jinanense]
MRCLPALSALVLLSHAACSEPAAPPDSSGTAGGGPGPSEPVPGADTVVTPHDKTHVYFTGEDNKRIVDAPATFPAEGEYSQIVLHLSLACPDGGCDAWDRFASLGLVTAKGNTPEEDTVLEIARYITPYAVEGAWDIDVTDLRPLLAGEVTVRAFIDTWVGPGSPYGAGWLVTASFEMKGGIPAKLPVAVLPVWDRRYVAYGDPSKPVSGSAPAQEIMLPEGSTSYALRTFITGHGQGNADNCAEFCTRKHTFTVGATPHEQDIWRSDCATTAVPGQQGTWKYPRAGWCPGADVRPWTVDITADVAGASTVKIAYGVEEYENTCRPDAAVCEGCSLGTGCDYDGGAHTEPNYQLSTVLIAYR